MNVILQVRDGRNTHRYEVLEFWSDLKLQIRSMAEIGRLITW